MFFKYLENHKFLAFSHRGGALENKENTIDAFQKSIEIGYKYIETDVQCTKDDRLIIFHDNDLLRINNQNIKISEILYEDLKKINIFEVGISYYGRKYADGKKITWKDGVSAIRCILKYNLFR